MIPFFSLLLVLMLVLPQQQDEVALVRLDAALLDKRTWTTHSTFSPEITLENNIALAYPDGTENVINETVQEIERLTLYAGNPATPRYDVQMLTTLKTIAIRDFPENAIADSEQLLEVIQVDDDLFLQVLGEGVYREATANDLPALDLGRFIPDTPFPAPSGADFLRRIDLTIGTLNRDTIGNVVVGEAQTLTIQDQSFEAAPIRITFLAQAFLDNAVAMEATRLQALETSPPNYPLFDNLSAGQAEAVFWLSTGDSPRLVRWEMVLEYSGTTFDQTFPPEATATQTLRYRADTWFLDVNEPLTIEAPE